MDHDECDRVFHKSGHRCRLADRGGFSVRFALRHHDLRRNGDRSRGNRDLLRDDYGYRSAVTAHLYAFRGTDLDPSRVGSITFMDHDECDLGIHR